MIPHNKPTLGSREKKAAARALRSGWVAEGGEVEAFEHEFSKTLRVPKNSAVALSSGTAALYLALHVLEVGKGDEIIIPTYVCSAVLNAIAMAGAKAVLVDIDPTDLNLSFADTKQKINKKTKAIIVTHTFGMPADVRRLKTLGVSIIEDCAQALGAKINGATVGTMGDIGVFSFYASKMITTGYGGMLVSKNAKFVARARDYRNFDGRSNYSPRFNFKLSDINAAIGRVQLARLPAFLKRRQKIMRKYRKRVPGDLLWPIPTQTQQPNFYRILLRTLRAHLIKKELEHADVQTIIPIERFELLHRYLGEDPKKFPVAERIASSTLSLPAYPTLTNTQVDLTIRTIKHSL